MSDNEYPSSHMHFSYTGIEGDRTDRTTTLPFGTPWHEIIYQVARTLEASGYYDVVNRIQVVESGYDTDDGDDKWISLSFARESYR